MWNRGWAALAVAVGLLLALAGGSSAQEKTKPVLIKAGLKAPEIAGEHTFNGKALNLSGLKGKVVLVDFWAVWCGPCIRAFPALAALQEEFKSQDFVVLGATSYQNIYGFDKKIGKLSTVGKRVKDEDGKVIVKGGLDADQEHGMLKDFAEHHKLKYQILVMSRDNWTKTVNQAYGVTGIPTLVLIDRLGVVRHVQVGFNPNLEEQLGEHIKKLVNEK